MVVGTVDLVAVVGHDVPLRRTCRTELHGACPFCGEGDDRFWVNVETHHWFCRQCAPRGGDAASYLMRKHQISFPEARQRLEGGTMYTPVALPPVQDAPSQEWRMKSLRWIDAWCDALWSTEGAKARAWLYDRGLTDETIQAARLGYCGKDEPTLGWHRGITIPLYGVDGALYGVKTRRPVPIDSRGTRKYVHLRGGHHCLFGRTQRRNTLLVVEGEFDTLLGLQLVGDLVDVATIGLGTPRGRWLAHLVGIRHILVCLDSDAAGRNGYAGMWSWMGTARQLTVPAGKDLTDAVITHGVDLRAWVAGLLAPPPIPAMDAPPVVSPAPRPAVVITEGNF